LRDRAEKTELRKWELREGMEFLSALCSPTLLHSCLVEAFIKVVFMVEIVGIGNLLHINLGSSGFGSSLAKYL